jgi:hypothetical protein
MSNRDLTEVRQVAEVVALREEAGALIVPTLKDVE